MAELSSFSSKNSANQSSPQPPVSPTPAIQILDKWMASYLSRIKKADCILAKELVDEPAARLDAIRTRVRDELTNQWIKVTESLTANQVAAAFPTGNSSTKVSVSTSTAVDEAQLVETQEEDSSQSRDL